MTPADNTYVSSAELRDADLRDADLFGAGLSRADLILTWVNAQATGSCTQRGPGARAG